MNIQLLPYRFDVAPLAHELAAHPEVWNEHRWRTEHPRSPHREVDDVWVRYNALENLGDHFNDPHESVWYPVIDKLPAAKHLATEVATLSGHAKLGGVLITRVPVGKRVYPHIDQGWHAGYYEKIGIQIAGHYDQAFCFDRERLSAQTGEAYWFRNDVSHWVTNDSDEDRITLIVCIRRAH